MKKNVNKLIAASLVTTMGLGYINYPVYAQEETDNTDTIFLKKSEMMKLWKRKKQVRTRKQKLRKRLPYQKWIK